jgi:hypothetical protein
MNDTWIPIQDLLKQVLEQMQRKQSDDLKANEWRTAWTH